VLAREDAPAPGTAGPRQAGPAGGPASRTAAHAADVASSLVIEDQPTR